MAEHIPKEFLELLLQRTDIVDIVDARVPVRKKTGSNYFSCCPFHDEKTASFSGKVTRINGSIDPTTQTVTVFIEVKSNQLKEGMYLEANLDARKEKNAIEISRSLLLDEEKIFVVKDSILDIIDVNAVYFSDAKVVLKNIPDGTIILSKPVPGAYAGMMVKTLKNKKDNNSSKTNKTK